MTVDPRTTLSLFAEPKGRRIAVVGAGVSGLAAAKLLAALGADVLLSDSSKGPSPAVELAMQGVACRFEWGGHSKIAGEQGLVVSPGVPEKALAHAARLPRVGELELASLHAPKRPLVAVTGTNGKTTTTALIGHLLGSASEENVFVGGNIGVPFARYALELMGGRQAAQRYVLEVSSYQAEQLVAMSPNVGVYLNLTPDHLDRYPSLAAYGEAKAQLFTRQTRDDVLVLNADDPMVQALHKRSPARVVWFSLDRQLSANDIWLEAAAIARFGAESYRLDRSVLRGRHNRQNQLAAIAAARSLGMAPEEVQARLDSFAGVEHRIERVADYRGVQWFNDSKATNDDAAQKALEAFSAPEFGGQVVWLAGGRDKRGGYAGCVRAAKGRVRAALLFGEAAPLIEQALSGVCPTVRVEDLATAVQEASRLAKSGDVVLLSPACSSFDQFKNYEERGRAFKTLVQQLAAGAQG